MPTVSKHGKPAHGKPAHRGKHVGDRRHWRVGILSKKGGDVGSGDGPKKPSGDVGCDAPAHGDAAHGEPAQCKQFVPAHARRHCDTLAREITKYSLCNMPPFSTFWFERRTRRFRCRCRKNPAMSEAWLQDGGMYEAAAKLLQRAWTDFSRLNLNEDAPFGDFIGE